MTTSEQIYRAAANTRAASKWRLFLASLMGKSSTLKQGEREWVVRSLNNKPYLLEQRRKP